MCFAVSVFQSLGKRLFSAEFSSPEEAKSFIEWRIEELLSSGAQYVAISDGETGGGKMYRAEGIADCVFLGMDWNRALVRDAA